MLRKPTRTLKSALIGFCLAVFGVLCTRITPHRIPTSPLKGWVIDPGLVDSTDAEDAQRTPTQSLISPSILAYEGNKLRMTFGHDHPTLAQNDCVVQKRENLYWTHDVGL